MPNPHPQEMERKKIAVFDFDGTITTRDSLPLFLKFTHGYVKLFWGFFILSPVLVLYLVKIIPNYKAKQLLFSWFYRGWHMDLFNEKCKAFAPTIDAIINPEALQSIKDHQLNQTEVIVITASVENWVIPWAKANGLNEVLGTKIETDHHGRITGRFLSPNCYGQEKVNRLLEKHPNRTDYILEAYGDSRGDKELIAFADMGYMNKF